MMGGLEVVEAAEGLDGSNDHRMKSENHSDLNF